MRGKLSRILNSYTCQDFCTRFSHSIFSGILFDLVVSNLLRVSVCNFLVCNGKLATAPNREAYKYEVIVWLEQHAGCVCIMYKPRWTLINAFIQHHGKTKSMLSRLHTQQSQLSFTLSIFICVAAPARIYTAIIIVRTPQLLLGRCSQSSINFNATFSHCRYR